MILDSFQQSRYKGLFKSTVNSRYMNIRFSRYEYAYNIHELLPKRYFKKKHHNTGLYLWN